MRSLLLPRSTSLIDSSLTRRLRRRRHAGWQTGRAETVEDAVERADINAAVGDGQSAEVIPRLDLIPARPELVAGDGVERVEHGVRRFLDPSLGAADVSRLGPALRRALAA